MHFSSKSQVLGSRMIRSVFMSVSHYQDLNKRELFFVNALSSFSDKKD